MSAPIGVGFLIYLFLVGYGKLPSDGGVLKSTTLFLCAYANGTHQNSKIKYFVSKRADVKQIDNEKNYIFDSISFGSGFG